MAKKRCYMVRLHGIMEFDGVTIHECIRYIGRAIIGQRFGAGLVTVKQAEEAGYTITTYTA